MSEIDKMLRFLHLDGPAADVLRELAVFRTVPRRTQLTEPDSDHHLVSFMVSGLLRGYLLDDRGGEITECFSFQYGDLRINSLDWERGHLDQYVETLEETAFVSFDLDELMPHILSYPELTAIFVRRISEAYAEQSCHRRILVRRRAVSVVSGQLSRPDRPGAPQVHRLFSQHDARHPQPPAAGRAGGGLLHGTVN